MALAAVALLVLAGSCGTASSSSPAADPFALCGAGESGVEVLAGELDSPFGMTPWYAI